MSFIHHLIYERQSENLRIYWWSRGLGYNSNPGPLYYRNISNAVYIAHKPASSLPSQLRLLERWTVYACNIVICSLSLAIKTQFKVLTCYRVVMFIYYYIVASFMVMVLHQGITESLEFVVYMQLWLLQFVSMNHMYEN